MQEATAAELSGLRRRVLLLLKEGFQEASSVSFYCISIGRLRKAEQ